MVIAATTAARTRRIVVTGATGTIAVIATKLL
jgi:hypothetical protein